MNASPPHRLRDRVRPPGKTGQALPPAPRVSPSCPRPAPPRPAPPRPAGTGTLDPGPHPATPQATRGPSYGVAARWLAECPTPNLHPTFTPLGWDFSVPPAPSVPPCDPSVCLMVPECPGDQAPTVYSMGFPRVREGLAPADVEWLPSKPRVDSQGPWTQFSFSTLRRTPFPSQASAYLSAQWVFGPGCGGAQALGRPSVGKPLRVCFRKSSQAATGKCGGVSTATHLAPPTSPALAPSPRAPFRGALSPG